MTKKIILSCVLSLVFGSQLCAQDKNISPEKSTSVAQFPVKSAIYFVDGVLLKPTLAVMAGANPLSSMNPNDIEKIEVIKGENAVIKYGRDAVNGVVLVTTRKK